jgi:CRISPR-associated endonuclease/helicase Cas3
MRLSNYVLWAKTDQKDFNLWLPLYIHMSDSAEIAKRIWRCWVPQSLKNIIYSCFESDSLDENEVEEKSERLFVFLAAAHDLGKATPAFQSKSKQLFENVRNTGLPCGDLPNSNNVPHALATYAILDRNKIDKSVAIVLGGHHGKPTESTAILNVVNRDSYPNHIGKDEWIDVQNELLEYAKMLSDIGDINAVKLSVTAQVLLSGLVIMTDWIASDENKFPYIDIYHKILSSDELFYRGKYAWENLKLPDYFSIGNEGIDTNADSFYMSRFNVAPRSTQTAVLDTAHKLSQPGLMIIEAPMGEGKTEAALAAAEVFCMNTARSGVFFALPTQATSDGLFPRILDWTRKLATDRKSIFLAHGKSRFNKDYNEIMRVNSSFGGSDDDDGVIVHEWLSGRKKGLLSDYCIGTIDQVLMAGLKHKHLALRHLGLVNKVLIIDECHAYDSYMSSYLYKVLHWAGAYGIPVIVLSATLPSNKRRELIYAYLNFGKAELKKQPETPEWVSTRAYPLITYTDAKAVKYITPEATAKRSLEVEFKYLPDDDIIKTLAEVLSDGGIAGIIVNTVKRAQTLTRVLSEHFENVELLHSRFISPDRIKAESELRERLGPRSNNRPAKLIVVGTQVMEQSLDIDFDVMISDICPMDLLIQRVGRLHRHERIRLPKSATATCYVTGVTDNIFDKGSEAVYGKYQLMTTKALLPPKAILPRDIPQLIQSAYADEGAEVGEELREEYKTARDEELGRIEGKKSRAGNYQICDPRAIETLIDWLKYDYQNTKEQKQAEAGVRDTEDTIEVIVVQCINDEFRILPWVKNCGGVHMPHDVTPDDELASALAECTVTLPQTLSKRWVIDKVICELEHNKVPAWEKSHWLRGELFLVIDENFKATLCGHQLRYDKKYGLLEESADE